MRAQEGQHARHKEEMGGQGIEQGVGGSKLVILIIGMMGCGWGERREWKNKKRAENGSFQRGLSKLWALLQ